MRRRVSGLQRERFHVSRDAKGGSVNAFTRVIRLGEPAGSRRASSCHMRAEAGALSRSVAARARDPLPQR